MKIRIPKFHYDTPTARQRFGLRRQAQRDAALECSRKILTAPTKAVSLPPHSKTTGALDSFHRIRPSFHYHQLPKNRGKLTKIVHNWWCCLAILLLLAAAVCRAADPNLNLMFDRWFAAQTNIQSWSADFTQTRTFKTLSQPLVSTGKVWVTMPGRFRWELGQPRKPSPCASRIRC